MSELRAVSFDLDGTLYESGPFRRRYVRQNWLRLKTIRTARRVRESLRGLAFADGEALVAEQTRLVAERLGRDEAKVRAQIEELFGPKVCRALKVTGPRPEARAAVEGLVDAGFQVAVLSDFRVEDKIAALGLDDLPWGARVAADAEGALKPHPRAFERVAATLSLPPDAILHVGDRADTDLEGASAAGMSSLLIGKSDGAVQRLDEVLSLVLARRG